MDRYKYEQQQLKAGRFPRSYKEAHGYDLPIKPRRDKFPWSILIICLLILFFVY